MMEEPLTELDVLKGLLEATKAINKQLDILQHTLKSIEMYTRQIRGNTS